MKRLSFFLAALGLLVSSCMPAFSQPSSSPTPISEVDLQLTAAVLSQQTLDALPTNTVAPSETPVIVTPTETAIQVTATETVNAALLTLTATLLAGTSTIGTEVVTTGTVSASTGTGTPTVVAANQANPTGSPQPLFYGTLPPKLPYGTIDLFNRSQVDVYISLRCVTKDGSITILEYPVKQNFKVSAPAGKYTYVAWVGGRQFDGAFSMDKDGFISITFFKDKINVKKH